MRLSNLFRRPVGRQDPPVRTTASLAPSLPFASFGAALCVAYAWPVAAIPADPEPNRGEHPVIDPATVLPSAAWTVMPN